MYLNAIAQQFGSSLGAAQGKYFTEKEVYRIMDKNTVIKLIGQFDKKQLQELVAYLVSTNALAEEALLDYCQKQAGDVETGGNTLIIETRIQQYWKKAAKIIEEFDEYGGGPKAEEEKAYDALEDMEKLLEENEVSWAVRKEVLDQMLRFAASDNSSFTDYLMDIALVICVNRQESLYLADFLMGVESSYYRGVAARLYLENGEEQKFVESKKANLLYGSDYLELAAYYEEHNEEQMAFRTVSEGLKKADGSLEGIFKYLFEYYEKNGEEAALENLYAIAEKKKRQKDTAAGLLYQYYRKKGDYGKTKEFLLKWMSCCNSSQMLQLYQKCRQELTEEDFAKEEAGILKGIRKRDLSAYFDILIDKGETKEVMEYITKHQQYRGWGLDGGHYFSKRLLDGHPREIVEMYWEEAAFYVGLGKEKNYTHAAHVLKEIQKIMKQSSWEEEWDARYRAFLEEHKRKKLLLRVLEDFPA